MSRLVAFGCSYTYGQGLEDCPDTTQYGPSKFAWPRLVADSLGIIECNLSKSGSGNAEIFDKILRYSFEPDDTCMILWSHFTRYDHYKMGIGYQPFRKWTEVHKEDVIDYDAFGYENAYKNYLTMHHCSLYLESINVKSVSANAFIPDITSFPKPKFLDIKNLINLPRDYKVDLALDNSHPGPKSQRIIAETMIEGLNNVIR